MTKSKFKTFGFWAISIITLFGLTLFLSAFLNTRTVQQKNILLVFGPIFTLLFGSQLWRDAKIILIDTLGMNIRFTNLFTRKKTILSFNDFDGFVDMYQSAKGGTYRVIYLVNNRKFVKKYQAFIIQILTNYKTLLLL